MSDEIIEESIETPEVINEDNVAVVDDGEAVQEDKQEDKPIDVESIKIEMRESGNQAPIDYGDDIDEEDVKTIGSIVEKQTAGVKTQLREAQDKAEIEDFLRERPEFSKYKPAIQKWIKDETIGKLAVKNIAYMVAADDLMKLGAKAEREAQGRADATITGGQQVRRPQGGAKDWTKASKDEFEAQKRAVLGQH